MRPNENPQPGQRSKRPRSLSPTHKMQKQHVPNDVLLPVFRCAEIACADQSASRFLHPPQTAAPAPNLPLHPLLRRPLLMPMRTPHREMHPAYPAAKPSLVRLRTPTARSLITQTSRIAQQSAEPHNHLRRAQSFRSLAITRSRPMH